MIDIPMPPSYKEYFKELEDKLNQLYDIAGKARMKGFDPSTEVESKITTDIAERIEKLIGPKGISERMRELEGMDRREMAFKVAEEIALGRFGVLEKEVAADQAIRTGLAIMTEGVTIAPIQGIPEIKIKQNNDRTQYLSLYFAGPIRPAGGTAQALTLVIADHVRRKLGLERFQPTDEIVNRFIEEVRVYERSVRRFQYHVTDEDLELALKNLPVEATGVSTDPYEVSNYREVSGIETNRLRGGALIVVVDGIVGRAQKLCGICDKLGLEGWEWLRRMGKSTTDENGKKAATAAFMEEIIVGRPVFAFPNTIGGFRLRYGRARTTGLAAVGIHPATMIILNRFLTTGVQFRIELPGKSAAVCPVDSIEPPVVRLRDGRVLRVDSENLAQEIYTDVDRILFNGDVLVNAGDFIQNNKNLLSAGYDEDQWQYDLEATIIEKGLKTVSETSGLTENIIQAFVNNQENVPQPEEAISLTRLGVPLHPRYIYEWNSITIDELRNLRSELIEDWIPGKKQKIRINSEVKESLENLLVPHHFNDNFIIIEEASPILEACLALDTQYVESEDMEPLIQVCTWAGFTVNERVGTYVGARMGRPEKAKERKMNPYIHCIYPIGNSGGPQRDITRPKRGDKVKVDLVQLSCPECGAIATSATCPYCGTYMTLEKRCPRCNRPVEGEKCPACNIQAVAHRQVDIEPRAELETALKHIGGSIPDRIKCVKRLMNEKRMPENLAKGILRGRYDLSVFKDGTLRFDLTDIPLTHFKPEEVRVSINRLRELGYTHDIKGEPLEHSDQMLELMVQDIVLPYTTGEYLVKVSRFLDKLLEDFYKMEPYYGLESPDDLIGHIVLGMAPHTSAAIVGRIIGYTEVRNCYAHPYWHAAKRRNCDGDEDAILMALDPLLNFSRSYLPEQSGGLMDAPLFIIPNLNPTEVDKESHNVDVIKRYPPEFYKLCKEGASPSDYTILVDTLGGRLGTAAQLQGFAYTKECSNINLGSHQGAYNQLKTMLDKLDSQLELTGKLRAVDAQAVGLKILNSHFMKDIVGNLRAFTRQGFRCSKCNKKYRRPPLKGVCDRCGGPILMTVHKGGIEKYLDPAVDLVERYELDQYYSDRLCLVREEIDAIFGEEEPEEEPHTQFNLTDFLRPKTKK